MFHPTLNDALAANDESLISLFPIGVNLRYNETVRCVVDGKFFSVYRDERGMYETALAYDSKCEDFVNVIPS